MATTPTRPKPAAPSSNGHGKAPAVTISPLADGHVAPR